MPSDHDHDHDHDPDEACDYEHGQKEAHDQGADEADAHAHGDPPPEPILEASTACLNYVLRATGVTLDFSPETLSVLDHYIELARADMENRPELVPLITRAVGAYFGEVVRIVVPSFWRLPSANVVDWQLCSSSVFFAFNPIGAAYDALYRSVEHDGPRSLFRVAPEDKDLLSARLAAMPKVPEDEYYLLTTRLEVIEAVVEALRARQEEKGYGETEFTEEDYSPAPFLA